MTNFFLKRTLAGSCSVSFITDCAALADSFQAVQMLGRIIFEALDYGIGEAEERPLSHGLETLIECMTRAQESGENTDNESQSADDEGIEKDAEDDHHCSFREVARVSSGLSPVVAGASFPVLAFLTPSPSIPYSLISVSPLTLVSQNIVYVIGVVCLSLCLLIVRHVS